VSISLSRVFIGFVRVRLRFHCGFLIKFKCPGYTLRNPFLQVCPEGSFPTQPFSISLWSLCSSHFSGCLVIPRDVVVSRSAVVICHVDLFSPLTSIVLESVLSTSPLTWSAPLRPTNSYCVCIAVEISTQRCLFAANSPPSRGLTAVLPKEPQSPEGLDWSKR